MTLTFFAAGDPKGQPRPKAFARKMGGTFVARVYDPGTAEGWKAQAALALRPRLPATPCTDPLRVECAFTFRRPKGHYRANGLVKPTAPTWHTAKPDADNAAKAVLDACTQLGLWQDDAQVVALVVTKRYADAGQLPGVHVLVASQGAASAAMTDDPPEPEDLFTGEIPCPTC